MASTTEDAVITTGSTATTFYTPLSEQWTFADSPDLQFESFPIKENEDEIRILDGFDNNQNFDFLQKHTQQLLREFFKVPVIDMCTRVEEDRLASIETLFPPTAPGLLRIAFLAESTPFTDGSGRHLIDVFTQWLIPGKPLAIAGFEGVLFGCIGKPEKKFLFCHLMLAVKNEDDLAQARLGTDELMMILKKNVAAVAYARKILEKVSLTPSQQQALFAEYLSSLENPQKLHFDQTFFEHATSLFYHAVAEKKLLQARENIELYLKNRRGLFDRDIFSEIQYFVWLYRANFIGERNGRHVTRIIAFQYLFRKHLKQRIEETPHVRHVALKIFPLNRCALGILIGINSLKDGEIFEERHILQALNELIPGITLLPGSSIQDRREGQKLRLFYLEASKGASQNFTSADIALLRKQLPQELKISVETLIHPLFMPRNDEDILRFSLQLCAQLIETSSPPQMAIFFRNQSSDTLCFTVLLARLRHGTTPPSIIHQLEISGSCIDISDLEARYPPSSVKGLEKEVLSFSAKLPKAPFLRSDYTVDVLQARQEINRQISEALGMVRDYNGGLLETQLRAEHLFIASLETLGKREMLLAKDFFYSITPPLMQVILETSLLKKLFTMLLEASKERSPFLGSWQMQRYQLILTKNACSTQKKDFQKSIEDLSIPSSQLTYAEIEQGEDRFIALIHQNEGLSHPLLLPKLHQFVYTTYTHP